MVDGSTFPWFCRKKYSLKLSQFGFMLRTIWFLCFNSMIIEVCLVYLTWVGFINKIHRSGRFFWRSRSWKFCKIIIPKHYGSLSPNLSFKIICQAPFVFHCSLSHYSDKIYAHQCTLQLFFCITYHTLSQKLLYQLCRKHNQYRLRLAYNKILYKGQNVNFALVS